MAIYTLQSGTFFGSGQSNFSVGNDNYSNISSISYISYGKGKWKDYVLHVNSDDETTHEVGSPSIAIHDFTATSILYALNSNLGVDTISSSIFGNDSNLIFEVELAPYENSLTGNGLKAYDNVQITVNSSSDAPQHNFFFGQETVNGTNISLDTSNINSEQFLISGFGNDEIMTGNYDDEVWLDNGTYDGFQTHGNDVIYTLDGDDWVQGNGGNDRIFLGDGDDVGRGGKGDDLLVGGKGNDFLRGARGEDILLGGEGDDFLDGDNAYSYNDYNWDYDDILYGGAGVDEYKGGYGDDLFVMSIDGEEDVIYDFNANHEGENDKVIIDVSSLVDDDDGNNGHGNDDDGDDDSNPGKGNNKGNNGHGNDDDGNDDSNPGNSNDPDDDSDDDGVPGKVKGKKEDDDNDGDDDDDDDDDDNDDVELSDIDVEIEYVDGDSYISLSVNGGEQEYLNEFVVQNVELTESDIILTDDIASFIDPDNNLGEDIFL